MTMKIHVSEVVFVDLAKTPKSIVNKAVVTARQKHPGVSLQYVSEFTSDVLTQGSSREGSRIEISKSLFTKGEAEGWRKRTKEAMTSVANAKQAFVCRLRELQDLTDMLKVLYGLDPIEGGD